MKKIVYCSLLAAAVFVGLESFKPHRVMKKDGAAPGYTGSPGDSLKDCTACHGGFKTDVNGWITSNIPKEGYEGGKKYTIYVKNIEIGATRFGFEISPQDLKGKLMGKMVITDTVKTKLVGADKYITYTANGIESIDSMTWSFDWIAPPAGSGDFVFYGGFNSNYEGHKAGDQTFLSTLAVKENNPAGYSKLENKTCIQLYPNPTSEYISVSLNNKQKMNGEVEVIDLSGRKCATLHSGAISVHYSAKYKLPKLKAGTYFLQVKTSDQNFVKSFVVE